MYSKFKNSFVPQKKFLFIENLRIKYLTCFKHQINTIVVLLFCGSFFQYYSVFWVNGVFKCYKLAVHFELTLDMIFVVLYKYLNCAVYKIIEIGHITDCNANYKIISLMMLFINSWCKLLKIYPVREICTYATSVKPSFAKYTP